MSTATTSLSNSLPLSIPKLDSTGLNWAIFSVHFQDAVEVKGFWGHFDGKTPHPTSIPVTVTATDGTTSIVADTAAKDQWDKDKRLAKSLLTQKIPNSTLMRVHTKRTVKENGMQLLLNILRKGLMLKWSYGQNSWSPSTHRKRVPALRIFG